MRYSQALNWTVAATSLPTITKHCSKCGTAMTYKNSQKFRVNANKKHLDIWLIYNCMKCDCSFNLTVHERIRPKELPQEQLEAFMTNNADLAARIGFDLALHQRNRVTLNLSEVSYEVLGELPAPGAEAVIALYCEWPLEQRIDKVLSHKLGISRSQFQKRVSSGSIIAINGENLQKDKLKEQLLLKVLPEGATPPSLCSTASHSMP